MCDAGVLLLGEIRCQSLMGVKGKRVIFWKSSWNYIRISVFFGSFYRVIIIKGPISLAIHCLFVRSQTYVTQFLVQHVIKLKSRLKK